MATCYETLTKDSAVALLNVLAGLRVSRTWVGAGGTCLFELGKLHTEVRTSTKGTTWRTRKGQVTLMIDPHWRVEKRYSVRVSSDMRKDPGPGLISVADPTLVKGLSTLKGQTVEAVLLTEGVPELHVKFRDGGCLRTFGYTYRKHLQPTWSIGFNDLSLKALGPVWDGVDVSPWLQVGRGRPEISYCFDPSGLDMSRLKQIDKQYRRQR